MELVWVAGAGVVALLLVVLAVRRFRGSDAKQRSRDAHEAAQEREPPVVVGDVCEFGVTEFTDHHSGTRVAVGKVEGFVLFAEEVPAGVSVGDVIRVKVTSFNRGRTSADATFLDTAA